MCAFQQQKTFRILLCGDFSGRANRGLVASREDIATGRLRPVDRDNLDELMERLEVRLARTVITADEGPVSIAFRELDDFDPDQLYEQVAMFNTFRSLRQRLLQPDTFADAAEEILGWGASAAGPSTGEQPSPASEPATEASAAGSPGDSAIGQTPPDVANLLDQMLADAQSTASTANQLAGLEWDRLIREVVAPVMPRRIDPRQDELVDCVDRATQTLMTALLHHPHFRKLESAWRGLDFLVRRVETSVELKISLVDLSQAELAADLLGDDPLSDTGIYRLVVEQSQQTPGAEPWSLICGMYEFGDSVTDIQLLGRLAQIAHDAQAPLLAAAAGSLVGIDDAFQAPDPQVWRPLRPDVHEIWEQLRKSPHAAYVSLLWPRYLIRLPYGAATRPIDAFAYEEMPGAIDRRRLLWGNPTLLAACSIGGAFAEQGWGFHLSQAREIGDLPVVTVTTDGEAQALPCGEMLLTDRAAEEVYRRGVTPVLSIQNKNAIRLAQLMSLDGKELGAGDS